MKAQLGLFFVLLAALGAGCASEPAFTDDDDDSEEESSQGGFGNTTYTGGNGGEGGGDTEEHPFGPQFLSFGTNVETVYDGESVTFTAVLTDPDGVEDVIGGSLLDASGAQYGAFSTSGQEGSYEMTIGWSDIQQVSSIDFAYGDSQSRTFTAEFWDVAGHVSKKKVTLSLACSSGEAGCDGLCVDTMNDEYACGSCNNNCYDDLCMNSVSCQAGTCVGSPVDCSWLDSDCTSGSCSPSTGDCVEANVANNTTCDDGDECTINDVCTAGSCAGTSVAGGLLFEEDFSDNAAGWLLGTEWAIGSATTSTGHSSHNPDPASDNSATTDNGVAGANIGGNVSIGATHAYYYLTSPSVNASSSTGILTLEFYRWLNSDYTPYMQNSVEVFDGTTWVTVWESGATSVADASWSYQSYDITAHQNANLQVRFGHSVGNTGAYTVSGWNIDDVKISSDAVCGG